MGFPFLNR